MQPTPANDDAPLPLPAAMRPLLLQLLSLGYRPGAAPTHMHNAPDAAIAWQVQSMLDDYAAFGGAAFGEAA